MTKRPAMMCFVVMFIIGVSSLPVRAQDNEDTRSTLKGISAVAVVVEALPDGAKVLGLTREAIQTDVELKLRLAGMRIVTVEEFIKVPGMPYLYVMVALTKNAVASHIVVELHQNARLDRNGESVAGVCTWDTADIGSNQTAQELRDRIKDDVDIFLNAWLSVNPKK